MAFVLSDRIKETTTTTGTGTYTLGGAVSGFETFTANLSNSDTTYYCCTDGTDFEVGLGTFTSSGTTLARTTIISSSNSNNAVSWSSGTRDIFCTLPGSKALALNGDNGVTLASDNSNPVIGITGSGPNFIRFFDNTSSTNAVDIIYRTTPNDLLIERSNGNNIAEFGGDDGHAALYFDDSKKLETTSGGVTITGALTGNVTGDLTGDVTGDVTGDLTGDVTGNVSGTAATVTGAAQSNITSVGTLTGLTTSGTINLSQSSGVAIKTTGSLGNADLTIIRAGIQTDSADFGFDLKYMGSRTGNNNSYSLFMHNQQGTDVEAMTVLQDGKVGINNTSPSAPLDVSGDAEITGTLTAGEVSATTLDIGGTNITSTATEINKLDGVTATTTELNYVDVTTLGTVQASKAVTADANGDVLFPDNENLFFGTGSDLKIFHNGSHSFIREQGTGDLKIQATSLSIEAGSGEEFITATANGAVELYHDDVKKFETTSDGATVTGTLTATDAAIGADTDIMVPIGRADVGAVFTDYAGFRHVDQTGGGDYALLQQNNGATYLNSASGQLTRFRINNATQAYIGDGYLALNTGVYLLVDQNGYIRFEGTSSNDHETTLNVIDPTADRTVSLPDATGTVLTTGNSDTPTTTTSSSDADFVLVDDGGTMKKITPSNLGITSGGASKGFAVAMAIAL